MNSIHLQQTLPQVFADRNSVTSDVWHQDLFFRKGEMYLIEAASGTGKSSLCSYIYGYRNDYQGIINFDETNIKAYSVKQWVDLRKHSLSMLFQDLRIFTELSALENVQLKNNLTGCKKKKEILSKACGHLRDYYGLQEPYIITKCFDAADKKFQKHDVCLFIVGDELRITADLIHGFLHGERDLGCYAFVKHEITLSKQPCGQQLMLEMKAGENTFLLGYRAKGFIEKNFIGKETD